MGTGPSPAASKPSSPYPGTFSGQVCHPGTSVSDNKPPAVHPAWEWETALPQPCRVCFFPWRALTLTAGVLFLSRKTLTPPALTSRWIM